MSLPKSFKLLSSYEQEETWSYIESHAHSLLAAARSQNLKELTNQLGEIEGLGTKLKKHAVCEAIKTK